MLHVAVSILFTEGICVPFSVCLFVCLYWYMQEGWVRPESLLVGSISVTVVTAVSVSSSLFCSVNRLSQIKLSKYIVKFTRE